MQPERWKKVEQLYEGAMALPPEKRAEFLAQACPDDAQLQEEVRSLLAQDADSFLEKGPLPAIKAFSSRHERLRQIFAAAIERPSGDRAAFLADACRGDLELVSEIERLLQGDAPTATIPGTSLHPPRLQPGAMLAGRFLMIRFIASGGMSDVYEVEDTVLTSRVALKTIRREITGDPQALARFKREIQLAKRVTHTNVCRIYDLGSHCKGDLEIVFLTMELVEGPTLARSLRDCGHMSCERALPLVIQMAEALGAAHTAGIVHRDFKTSNVMLAGSGDSLRAIVTDFGLARLSVSTDDASLTDTGKIVGTPPYMAPEQLTNGEITSATDIYALGLVMYEMVTGRKPFEGRTAFESAMKRLNQSAPPPAEHVPGLDSRWNTAILRCLERDPQRRFSSTGDLVRALKDPTRSATLERLQALGKKKTTRATALLAAAAAMVLGVAAGIWTLGRHRPPAAALRWYEQGTRALRDGTLFTAMKEFDAAVRLDPGFALAHARLAEAAVDLDYNDKAKSEMLRASPALQSFFLSGEEKLRLEAVYFVLLNDFRQAAAKYKELAAKVPSSERAAILVDLGRAFENGGKFKEALDSYSQSIRLDSQFAAAFLRRAMLEGKQRMNANAASDFDAAEQLYQTENNAEGITEVSYQRALLFRRLDRLADARAPAEKSLEMARNNRDEYHQIKALLMLSYLLYNSGDTDGGEKRAREAIAMAQQAGIESLSASGLVEIGRALFVKGENAAAEPYLRNAAETARRFEDVQIEAEAELVLEQVLVKLGRPDDALAVSKQAMLHFEQVGDKSGGARAAIPAARMTRDRGDYEDSAALFRQALQLAERANDPGTLALASRELGMVRQLQEQYPDALANFARSAQLIRALNDLNRQAYAEVNRADALRSLGKYQEAEEELETAEGLDRRLNGLKPLLATISFSRAEMDLARSRLPEVEKDVRNMTEAANTGIIVASAKRLLGLQRLASGRAREGLSLCEQALEMAKTLGNDSLLRNSELAVAEAKLATGDAQGALALASDLAKYFEVKGQLESELKALAIASSASRGADRDRYTSAAKVTLVRLRQEFGESFAGFTSRPDIHQIIIQLGLNSSVN
jgi:tetratricopeptide (TPR) repeat protein/tRNA A-37 threonylcarbamoyl transferase component Bud32